MNDHNAEFWPAVVKVLLAWLGTVTGMTLSDWVLLATLVYTVLQAWVLWRDKLRRRK